MTSMVELCTGDLFAADVEALVNPVNCEGVMGKGLALAFKNRFPAVFAVYRAACKRGDVVVGRMHVVEVDAPPVRWVVNFPTKRHWRDASRLGDIAAGLDALVTEVERLAIRSIAIPALGCGLGGLAWDDVHPLIDAALASTADVRALVFPPR